MPSITKVQIQKKNNQRVNIFLDGKFGFGLDLENYIKLKLKVGDSLNQKEIENITKKAEFSKNYSNLIKYATTRPRSTYEIRSWLKRKKVPSKMQNRLLEKVNQMDLLDDVHFARWWVEQRNQFRPRSITQIYFELSQKNIDKKIIDKVLSQVEVDEKKHAKSLLSKNLHRWSKFPNTQKKQKASQYLYRKGFKWENIKRLIDELDKYD